MPLKLRCATTEPTKVSADLLALGVFAADPIFDQEPIKSLDKSLQGALKALIQRQEFTGKKDQVLELETLGLLPSQRLALIGLGEPAALELGDVRAFSARAARLANAAKACSLAFGIPDKLDESQARALGEGVVLGAYRFTKYFTGDRQPKAELNTATLLTTGKLGKVKKATELGVRIGTCVTYARDLINEPPNELTPIALATYAEQVSKRHGLQCKVFDGKTIEAMGMKLFIAVAQGSVNEPRLVHITYEPTKPSSKKLVVVGKGLTFDSGGLCIKPAAGMEEMKSDMAGAANVIGFMAAVAEIAPDIEVHGIIGSAENMPDAASYRPGDIFGSLDGKTVEIINTDAEGRLVLADALSYACKLEPTALICNATLTGACVVALGQRCSGFFSTNKDLGVKFQNAADQTGEQFWQLPLLEDMRSQLKSDVADLKHVGNRWGGAISAALFLTEFVGDTPFIHCDIAGPALAEKPYRFYSKGGSGQGVLTFLQLLESGF